MERFTDGAAVRLRSRACELFLHADDDGVGVSLNLLRASGSTWKVRRVERGGVSYVALESAAGRFLSADPARPGARGLLASQSDEVDLWSAAVEGGDLFLRRSSEQGFLCPFGSGVGVRHRGRKSLLPRWRVEPAPVATLPPADLEDRPAGEGAPGEPGIGEVEPEEAPAQPSRLSKLCQAMEDRLRLIRENVEALQHIQRLVRTGNYESDTPMRKTIEDGEETVVNLLEGYHIIRAEVRTLSNDAAEEGVPVVPLPLLRQNPEDLVTPSIRRRLLRRQQAKEERARKALFRH